MAESRKRKKSYYSAPHPKKKKPAWKEELCPGMSGILVTTNDQEKLCVPEAYNLLNEYADQLYGPELTHNEDSPSDNEDIAAALAQEAEKLRGSEQNPRRFQAINSGAKHVVFIKCRPPVDPVELVHYTLSDVLKTKQHKSRFCQRFIPVSTVCRASPEDIQKHAPCTLAPHFYQNDLLLKFAVVYKARNNKDVCRDDIIKTLASLATRNGDYSHTVDLNDPDLTIVVEIVKSNCCVSVLRDFNKLKKYNIHSIVATFESEEAADSAMKDSQQDNVKINEDSIMPSSNATSDIKDEDTSGKCSSGESSSGPSLHKEGDASVSDQD